MNTLLWVLLGAVAAMYFVWVLFLSIMSLASAQAAGKLPTAAVRLAYPLLAIGYVSDFSLNVFVASWLFLEPPRELLVTARLTRHIKAESGWRKRVATWICKNLLDWADPKGCHCQ